MISCTSPSSGTFNIGVDGHVGRGKRTLLKHFQELSPETQVSHEPVEL